MKDYSALKKKLKVIGIVLVLVCGILFLIGIIDFFSCFGKSTMPKFFWMAMVGLPGLAIGGNLIMIAHKQDIERFAKSESAPVTVDYVNYVADGTKESIGNVVKEIRSTNDEITCPKCHNKQDKDATFCTNCGEKLQKVCANCQEVNEADANFCAKCGTKL